jgi:S-formylglutathione hydrolase FrmB
VVLGKLTMRLQRTLGLAPGRADLAVARLMELTSPALGRPATLVAYVPQNAQAPGGPLPVVYLLHGATGRWTDWSEHAHRDLQTLAHRLRLIIVTPDGGTGDDDGWYLDVAPGKGYRSHLLAEVLPAVEGALPAAQVRGIAGLSMGGHGAVTLALENPGLFRSASSMSGVLDLTKAPERPALQQRLGRYQDQPARWTEHSALHLVQAHPEVARAMPLLITVGASDHWAPVNRTFHQTLTGLGIPHTFEETPGGHDWPYWTSQLERHLAWHAERLHAAGGARQAPRIGTK